MSTNQLTGEAASSGLALPPPAAIPDEVCVAAKRLGVGQYLAEVVAFTVDIFGSFSNVEVVPDPEIPDCEYIIFAVTEIGSVDNALDKGERWSERLRATVPRAPRIFSFVTDFVE